MFIETKFLLVGEVTGEPGAAEPYDVTPLQITSVAIQAHDVAVAWVGIERKRRVHIYSFDRHAQLEHVTCVCRVDQPWLSVLYGEGLKPHHRTALLSLLHQLFQIEMMAADDDDECDLAADPPADPTTARAGDCPTAPAAEVECNDPMCTVCHVRRHQTDPPMNLCRQCYDVACARAFRSHI